MSTPSIPRGLPEMNGLGACALHRAGSAIPDFMSRHQGIDEAFGSKTRPAAGLILAMDKRGRWGGVKPLFTIDHPLSGTEPEAEAV